MTRNLAKRVEQLETRIMPDTESQKMVIHFVESNGEIVGSMDLEVAADLREATNCAGVAAGDEAADRHDETGSAGATVDDADCCPSRT